MKSPQFSLKHEFTFCLFIAIAVTCIYGQVVHHDFVNYDDDIYITANTYVQKGVTLEGIQWAFSFQDKGKTYWHPLTWLSHMVDISMFGADSGRHHIVNVFWHLLNTWLLFFILSRMTGMFWLSVFVAVLFAVHPINVETVAWVSQRKNLLSTFFSFLTIASYFIYAQTPGKKKYILIVAVFVTGLMSKPMLITLPFVLLLLDYWPLQRIAVKTPEGVEVQKVHSPDIQKVTEVRCILEKVPLICITLLTAYVVSQSFPETKYVTFDQIPLLLRVENLIVSYISYIGSLIWPFNLALLYPYPKTLSLTVVTACAFLLLVITLLIFYFWRQKPLTVGWLWFLGTIAPVSGLVQAGIWPAKADHWLYVPAIGIFLIVAWVIQRFMERAQKQLVWSISLLMCIVVGLGGISWAQVRHWKESITLFEHTVRVTDDNVIMHTNLGESYWSAGRFDEAVAEYQKAISIYPYSAKIHYNVGIVLRDMTDCDGALKYFGKAVSLDPNYATISYKNLGVCYAERGEYSKAARAFQETLRRNPGDIEAKNNLMILETLQRRPQ